MIALHNDFLEIGIFWCFGHSLNLFLGPILDGLGPFLNKWNIKKLKNIFIFIMNKYQFH